jgi:serine/threonine protein kinase
MRKDRILAKDHGEYVRAERDLLTSVVHPYIVTLRFSFQVSSHPDQGKCCHGGFSEECHSGADVVGAACTCQLGAGNQVTSFYSQQSPGASGMTGDCCTLPLQTPARLYLVLDFLNGGHLFFNLYRQGVFTEDVARLYCEYHSNACRQGQCFCP